MSMRIQKKKKSLIERFLLNTLTLKVVVLPAPFRPNNPKHSPFFTPKHNWFTATCLFAVYILIITTKNIKNFSIFKIIKKKIKINIP